MEFHTPHHHISSLTLNPQLSPHTSRFSFLRIQLTLLQLTFKVSTLIVESGVLTWPQMMLLNVCPQFIDEGIPSFSICHNTSLQFNSEVYLNLLASISNRFCQSPIDDKAIPKGHLHIFSP